MCSHTDSRFIRWTWSSPNLAQWKHTHKSIALVDWNFDRNRATEFSIKSNSFAHSSWVGLRVRWIVSFSTEAKDVRWFHVRNLYSLALRNSQRNFFPYKKAGANFSPKSAVFAQEKVWVRFGLLSLSRCALQQEKDTTKRNWEEEGQVKRGAPSQDCSLFLTHLFSLLSIDLFDLP